MQIQRMGQNGQSENPSDLAGHTKRLQNVCMFVLVCMSFSNHILIAQLKCLGLETAAFPLEMVGSNTGGKQNFAHLKV